MGQSDRHGIEATWVVADYIEADQWLASSVARIVLETPTREMVWPPGGHADLDVIGWQIKTFLESEIYGEDRLWCGHELATDIFFEAWRAVDFTAIAKSWSRKSRLQLSAIADYLK